MAWKHVDNPLGNGAVGLRLSGSLRIDGGLKLRQPSYWCQVASVFTGAILAQAIPVVGSLFIARIYAPDAFGLFATWLGISLVTTVFMTGRLEAAFGLEADGESRNRLVAATVFVVMAAGSILVVIVLSILAVSTATLGHLSPLLVVLLVPMSIGAALSLIWQSWAANSGEIKKLSTIRIFQAFCITSLQIIVGWFSPTAASLAVAQIGGVWLTVLFNLYLMPIHSTLFIVIVDVKALLRDVWTKYRRFPTLSLPADLINTAAAQLPIIFLTSRFGAEIGGYYALAIRMMGAPISILGGAVRDVFKRSASEDFRSFGNCRGIYNKTFVILFGSSILMIVAALFLAKPLFLLFFGPKWQISGVIAVWLIPLYALRFMASPLSYTFYIAQKQHADLVWQGWLLVVTLIALTGFDSYRITLIVYSLAYALMYTVYLVLSYRYSRIS